MSERQNVVIVPGLHPLTTETIQYGMYKTVAAAWPKDQFDVHILQVGWHGKGETTATQQDRLCEGLDKIEGPIWAIGVSAGGLAIIGAMETNEDKIPKVVTIASPLCVPESAFDQLRGNRFIPAALEGHYQRADTYLQRLGSDATDRVVSLYGKKDMRVPPSWSRRDSVRSYELPGRRHGFTILGGLALHREKILAPFAQADS